MISCVSAARPRTACSFLSLIMLTLSGPSLGYAQDSASIADQQRLAAVRWLLLNGSKALRESDCFGFSLNYMTPEAHQNAAANDGQGLREFCASDYRLLLSQTLADAASIAPSYTDSQTLIFDLRGPAAAPQYEKVVLVYKYSRWYIESFGRWDAPVVTTSRPAAPETSRVPDLAQSVEDDPEDAPDASSNGRALTTALDVLRGVTDAYAASRRVAPGGDFLGGGGSTVPPAGGMSDMEQLAAIRNDNGCRSAEDTCRQNPALCANVRQLIRDSGMTCPTFEMVAAEANRQLNERQALEASRREQQRLAAEQARLNEQAAEQRRAIEMLAARQRAAERAAAAQQQRQAAESQGYGSWTHGHRYENRSGGLVYVVHVTNTGNVRLDCHVTAQVKIWGDQFGGISAQSMQSTITVRRAATVYPGRTSDVIAQEHAVAGWPNTYETRCTSVQ